jgi:hypothetical protein
MKQIFNFFTKKQSPPKNGEHITITWLPNTRNGAMNAYIGYFGIVEDLTEDGRFVLNSGTSILVINTNKYKHTPTP